MKSARLKTWAFCLPLSLFLLFHSNALAWRGTVVELADGDSGFALRGWEKVEFRLYGIDAPELEQSYGRLAKSFAAGMLLWKKMEFKILERDRYGREVGLAYVNGRCVNEELIKAGFAWTYEIYCKESFCDRWRMLQQQAKDKRKGLWKKNKPIPPWEYRRHKRSDKPPGVTDLLVGLVTDYHGNSCTGVLHRFGCRHYDCKD
ncbi:MAG: thermonuclease family protein [Desulforhabdus sp.]|jgi:endonuclease YncB( thermonuclease family)|nr:thermonuclease family protein [Desulforhabdus sp.]